MNKIEDAPMMKAPFFWIGFINLVGGLVLLPFDKRKGAEWVPVALILFGLTLIIIKLVWVLKHGKEITALAAKEQKNAKKG